ncbi:glutamate ABC transporter substrate-binding protein [Nocardia sp. NPDC057227]|uniref:glutamate ABC transporter substrate-binding protein n=1 Tax=Nocardia sp. NPDC057227 TaxID=3346056 RepID=UPI00362921CD
MRATIPLLLLLALTAVAGCAEPTAPGVITRTAAYTAPPLPAQAVPITPGAPLPTAATEDCGDPTASLRPTGALTGPAVDAIRRRGRLIVGLDAGSNLLSFRDPVSGSIVGFDADIAREVARDLLGDPNAVEFRSLGSADRERALIDRTVDMVAKTMTVTCERRRTVTFSSVYLRAQQRVLALENSGINGIGDLAGRRVCVVRGTTSLDRIRLQQPAATVLTVPTWADCLVVLQQRQVDAASTDDTILAGLAAQDPYTRVVGPGIADEPYGIGIPKGDDDLVRAVNATLERIRADGTWTAIHRRWLAVLGPSPAPPAPTYQD